MGYYYIYIWGIIIYIYIVTLEGWLTPGIQWCILKRSNTPKSFDSRCNSCLEEKIHILLFPKKLLNKRSELIARCIRKAKFKL